MLGPRNENQGRKNWPLCYGKAKMSCSNLIAKEFVLGIIVEKFNKAVSWMMFAEETNINQHNKFFKRMARMEVQREKLMKTNSNL
jgi:hypothetical protein